jgi:hypothetical protein
VYFPTKDGGSAPHGRAPTILVVGNLGDTSTPYRWSRRLAAELESAVLLTTTASQDHFGRASTGQCSRPADLTLPATGDCAERA